MKRTLFRGTTIGHWTHSRDKHGNYVGRKNYLSPTGFVTSFTTWPLKAMTYAVQRSEEVKNCILYEQSINLSDEEDCRVRIKESYPLILVLKNNGKYLPRPGLEPSEIEIFDPLPTRDLVVVNSLEKLSSCLLDYTVETGDFEAVGILRYYFKKHFLSSNRTVSLAS